MIGSSFFEQPARSILHPTDFSEASELAFAHALAVAVTNQASLTIMHVTDDEHGVSWENYPSVRRTLERWGHLEPGSSRRDIAEKLGVEIEKVYGVDTDVSRSILDYLEHHFFDLIILATEEESGLPNWLRTHVAVPVSEKSKLPTLFVRNGARGCVSPETGVANLDQVLIPVDHRPDSSPAMERIVWTMDKVGGEGANVTLLHVGPEKRFPKLDIPDYGAFNWNEISSSGSPATTIVEVANEISADLIVMVTEGRQGLVDVLRGSTTQQVLRQSPCPLFTIPSA